MMIAPIVLPFLLASNQQIKEKPVNGQEPPQFYLVREVNLKVPPDQTKIKIPENVLNWKGWGYLNGKEGEFPKLFLVDRDWSGILDPIMGHLPSVDAFQWKVKVVVLRRTDGLISHPSGIETQLRDTIENGQLQTILEALLRAKRVLESQSGDQLNVDLSVVQDEEPFIYNCKESEVMAMPPTFNPIQYLSARVNGGSFVADDKIYRGPYNQIIVVWPMASHRTLEYSVNGMPVTCISSIAGSIDPGLLTTRILSAFDLGLSDSATKHGYPHSLPIGHQGEIMNPFIKNGLPISILTSLLPVSGAEYEVAKKMPAGMEPEHIISTEGRNAVTNNCVLTLVKSKRHGDALQVQLNGLHRRGGFSLPMQQGMSLSEMAKGSNHILTFWVKTSSADPLHIGYFANGLQNIGSLGDGLERGPSFAVDPDGNWHHVAVDLSKLANLKEIPTALYIGADSEVTTAPKKSYLAVIDEFADFALSNEVPSDAVALREAPVPPTWIEAENLLKLANSADTPEGSKVFEQALQSEVDVIKLNALDVLSRIKAPSLVKALIGASVDVDPRIQEAAVKALIFQGTDPCIAFLRMQLAHGLGPRAKGAAALALATLKDPHLDAPLSSTIGLNSWIARIEGIKALKENGGPEANSLISAFLRDPDPEVRLTAVKALDPLDADAMKKVLFNSVNDASDAVRAAACEKVLQSTDEDVQKQGLRGFTDDSSWERVMLLDWISENPVQLTRPSIIDNLKSPYPSVRAASLSALGAFSSVPTQTELAPILQEQIPEVQKAIMLLAKIKKVQLPSESLKLWAQSSDAEVSEWAKSELDKSNSSTGP